MRTRNTITLRQWYLIVSEISLSAFIVLVLFLIRQTLIILNWKTKIFTIYSDIYYWVIVIIPGICVVYVLIDLFHPIISLRRKVNAFFLKIKVLLLVVNMILGFIVVCIILNSIVMKFVIPEDSQQASEVTIIYDSGSLNRLMVKELATPMVVELDIDKTQLSILPLNEKNIEAGINGSRYLIVLSHGAGGKVYSTNPLQAYTYEELERIPKPDLKLVYFSACYLGMDGNDVKWKEAMAPAEIIVYDRESAVLEHIVWLLFKGKEIIKRLG